MAIILHAPNQFRLAQEGFKKLRQNAGKGYQSPTEG
jgi:hypothetical protein